MLRTCLNVHGVACFTVLSLVLACGDDDAGSVASVAKLVGSEGGTVELVGGGKVVIPPGALSEATTIKITKLDLDDVAPVPFNLEAAGKPYAFEPHGTQFAMPVKIEVPFDGAAAEVRPIKLDDQQDTTWETVVGGKSANGKLSFDTASFSVILAARPRRNSGVITLPDGAILDAADVVDANAPDAYVPDAAPALDAGDDAAAPADAAALSDAADAAMDAAAATCSIGYATDGVTCLRVTQLALGKSHSCALLSDGTVRCWGYNFWGQLGDGTMAQRSTPTQVSGLTGVVEIAAGESHTCARLTDTTVKCWGWNAYGQLGDGSMNASPIPVAVVGLRDVAEIAAASGQTCARLTGGTMKCWGVNGLGQLGDGTTTTPRLAPVDVLGLVNVAEIALGYTHGCARLADATVACWGYNVYGSIGDGSTNDSSTPVILSGLLDVAEITAGDYHTCVRLTDGSVRCWGYNNNGQLGDDSMMDRHVPTAVSGLTSAIAVTARAVQTCARLMDDSVQCWGNNDSGQLAIAIAGQYPTPTAVPGLSGIVELAIGYTHGCARQASGIVQCWGDNSRGQLGTGSPADSYTPVEVAW